MRIRYSISLWSFYHYANTPSLERVLELARRQGFGIELWSIWKDETDLFDETGLKRLKEAVGGMEVTLHGKRCKTLEDHKKQIDAARTLGAGVIVVHSGDLAPAGDGGLDVELAREAVACARESGVQIALENGDLAFLSNALEQIDGLAICLDVGHVYFTPSPLSDFLDVLKERIIHLHIQDILPETESHLPVAGPDHYIPGTGNIPASDWKLLCTTLSEIDFDGVAVFEIQPRNAFQTAFLGKNLLESLLVEP